MPIYGDDAGHIVTPHTDTTGRAAETPDSAAASAKAVLGSDTFNKPDPRPTIWPGLSEGDAAAHRLMRGATPSDVVGEFRGTRGDIELPPAPKSKGKK